MKSRLLKIVFIAIFTIVGMAIVIGCKPELIKGDILENPKVVRVAFSQTESDNPWITEMINSFEMAAAYQSMEFIYRVPEENTTEWQKQDLEQMLMENIDYLIISPRETTILEDILSEAKEKGIPVILMSSQADMKPGELYATSISTDYVQEGIMCAKILAEKYLGKECRIIEIKGTEGSSIARDRSAGFREEISKHKNLSIVGTEIGDFNRITAQRAMEHIIVNYPNQFDAVFAHSDEDGLGVLQALKVAGYEPGKNISLVSVNGLQDVIKAIIAGEYTATVENNPRLGFVAFDIIAQMERDFKPTPHVVMPYRVINGENAEELLELSY